MGIVNNILAGASGQQGYPIANSLRFQGASSQYLSRTFGTPTNSRIYTWSGWVKRGTLSTDQGIFSVGTTAGNSCGLVITAANLLQFYTDNGSTSNLTTTQVFRDPSAWYHLVLAIDTTQATASNRIKIYVNGTQVTAFNTATYMTQNATSLFNTAAAHYLGSQTPAPGLYLDGYMAEVNFIDGQALTPSSFGETDSLTGVWIAKKYTGTYGTNGFYLKFNDGTSTTTLGQDRSGNGNNWTLNNFTRSAGVSDCWMYDVPSGNGSPTATQPSSNYAVMNPIGSGITGISAANLNVATTSTGTPNAYGSMAVSSGKWYWEFISISDAAVGSMVGVAKTGTSTTTGFYTFSTGYGYYSQSGQKFNNHTGASYGSTWTTNDVIGVALDLDAGTLTFYKNNVSQGTAYSSLSGEFTAAITDGGTGTVTVGVNFGQRSFAYTPPSGFKALCTANLPTPTIAKGNQYMDISLYTGNATARSITNSGGFQPDFLWIKSRSAGASNSSNQTFNSVAGNGKVLYTDLTNAEFDSGTAWYTPTSNGFDLTSSAQLNTNTVTYVAWQWNAGGSTVTNTSGSISSQVRASTTAGVSVMTYTGNGVASTVGHGLGVAPKMIIVKDRTQANSWGVYHDSIGNTRILFLESTSAQQTSSTAWNNTSPTSTVFTIGATGTTNQNTKGFVAYCFAEIAGFSKFGSYTGNGSTDGPFVYCGFRPKYVLIKRTDTTGDWWQYDTSRSPYNTMQLLLFPNTSGAEEGPNVVYSLDVLSNGIKLRNSQASVNASGGTYIYMAFAENPFSVSNAR